MSAAPSYSGSHAADEAGGGRQISHEGGLYPSAWERCAPYFAEYAGVFVLTLTFLYNSSQLILTKEDASWALNSTGFMVCSLVYALGHISGAHLNPSISISLALTGRLGGRATVGLVIAQLLGAGSAAIIRLQFSHAKVDLEPLNDHGWQAVVTLEVLFTALLCFVYLNCAASFKNNPLLRPNGFAGLCVGLVYVAAAFAMRNITHAVCNSAIAVGLGFVESRGLHEHGHKAVLYFCIDIVGAFIGTGLYRVVRPDEASREGGKRLGKGEQIGTRIAAEFIGTFYLILTKAMNRLAVSDVQAIALGPESWSVMAVLTALAYSLGSVSGSYFNPALTIGAWACGRGGGPNGEWSGHEWVFYILAQVLGSIAASSVFVAMSNGRDIPQAAVNFSGGVEFFAEGTFTAFLTYVVLASRCQPIRGGEAIWPKQWPSFHGFVYGAVHVAGGFSIGPITGSMLNPAVVLSFVGVDLFHGHIAPNMVMYIVYQVVGAVVGAGIFAVLNAELYRDLDKEDNEPLKDEATDGKTPLASILLSRQGA